MKLKFSKRALVDLEEIGEFIEQDIPEKGRDLNCVRPYRLLAGRACPAPTHLCSSDFLKLRVVQER